MAFYRIMVNDDGRDYLPDEATRRVEWIDDIHDVRWRLSQCLDYLAHGTADEVSLQATRRDVSRYLSEGGGRDFERPVQAWNSGLAGTIHIRWQTDLPTFTPYPRDVYEVDED